MFDHLRRNVRSRPARTSPRGVDRRAVQLRLEELEERLAPAVLTVNSNFDGVDHTDALLTLREAIAIVNTGSTAGHSAGELTQVDTSTPLGSNDTILFANSLSGAITLTGGQLAISHDLTIRGPGQSALTISGNNGGRVFQVAPNTTVAISDLSISQGRVIQARGAGIENLGTLTVTNVTLADNYAEYDAGAIANTGGSLTVVGSTLTRNSTNNSGGAIYSEGGALLAIRNSSITHNSGRNGGGVRTDWTINVSITNSDISNNTASESGGGLRTFGARDVTVSNSTLTHNTSAAQGGGIYYDGGGGWEQKMTITGTTISNNTAVDHGGGIYHNGYYNAILYLTNSTVSNNTTQASGGGIFNAYHANIVASGGSITGNTAVLGGGFFNYGNASGGGGFSLSGTTISNNTSHASGGGLFNEGTLTATNASITQNVAFGNGGNGGGGGIANAGTATFTNSTISNNTATAGNYGRGGGIVNASGTITLLNSTLAANTAQAGGGVYNFNRGNVTLTNVTVSGNSALLSGGGLFSGGNDSMILHNSTVVLNRDGTDGSGRGFAGGISAAGGVLFNSIVAGNVTGVGMGTPSDIGGTLGSTSANNLIGDPTSPGGLVHGVQGNIVGNGGLTRLALSSILDPVLRNNGGPTLTHALTLSSLAINAGNNALAPATDQRGLGRVYGGRVDLGAVESGVAVRPGAANPSVQSITLVTPQPSFSTTPSTLFYRVLFSEPVTGVDVGDFAFTGLGSVRGTVTQVSAEDFSGRQYRVRVDGASGFGDGRLTLNDNNSIRDSDNNPLQAASPIFAVNSTFLGYNQQPQDVALGDLNGDGRPERITTVRNYPGPDAVTVSINQGDGTFADPVTYTVDAPTSLILGDFNSDGKLDVIALSAAGQITLLPGNGNGTLGSAQIVAVIDSAGFGGAAAGDVDGDAKLDLVIGSQTDQKVNVLLGNGNGTFQAPLGTPLNGVPTGIGLGDVNGDHKLDVAVTFGNDDRVSVFRGNGIGTFAAPVTMDTSHSPTSVVLVDLNSDGFDDVAVVDTNTLASETVSIFRSNGDGTFAERIDNPSGLVARGIVAGDFNRDGIPDLAICNSQEGTVGVYIGNGDGTVQPAVKTSVGAWPGALAIADLNGDGVLDLATADANGTTLLLASLDDGSRSSEPVFIRNEAPYIIDVVRQSPTTENVSLPRSGLFTFEVNFNEPVTGLSPANFRLNLPTTLTSSQAQPLRISGADSKYFITVGPMIGSGRFSLELFNPTNIIDATGESLVLDTPIGASYNVLTPTTTTLTTSATTITYGDTVTFNATVKQGTAAVSGGTITLTVGTQTLASNVPVDSTGRASVSLASKLLRAGAQSVTIVAAYDGGSGFPSSTGALLDFKINQRPITVSPDGTPRVYDGTTTSSLKPVITVGSLAFNDTPAFTQAYSSPNAGPGNSLLVTGAVNDGAAGTNYRVTIGEPVNASVALIRRRPLVITPTSVTKTYDGTNTAPGTPTVDGLVSGDYINNLSQSFRSLHGNASARVPVRVNSGFVVVSQGVSNSANYNVSIGNDSPGTILKKTLTVTPDNKNITYGGVPTLTASYNGFVTGQGTWYLDGVLTLVTTATSTSGVGNYPITGSGLTSPNYDIVYQTGTLTINRAPLVVTPIATSKTYGGVNPTLGVSYTGFVLGQTAASLTRQPQVVTTATALSPVGTYPITASGADSLNYEISYADSTLTVNPATLVITANNKSKVQGDLLPPLTVSYSGFVGTETLASLPQQPNVTVTTTATAGSTVADYPITVVATPATLGNYSLSSVNGVLSVTEAREWSISLSKTSPVAGSSVRVTVTLKSGGANFSGPVTLTFTDPSSQAILPSTINLSNGIGTGSVTFATAGMQAISVRDSLNFAKGVDVTVNVQPAGLRRLEFASQPSPQSPNERGVPVVVRLLDAFGNLVTTATSVALGKVTGIGAIAGTTTVSTSTGLATFADLTFDKEGTYTLRATVGTMTVTSSPFQVFPPNLVNSVVAGDLTILTYGRDSFVGFTPTSGQAFVPLLFVPGGVNINSIGQLSSNDSVYGVVNGVQTLVLNRLPFVMPGVLTSDTSPGVLVTTQSNPLSVANASFTPSFLRLIKNNADNKPEIRFTGTARIANLSVAVSGTNYVALSGTGLSLSLTGGAVTGTTTLAGVPITGTGLSATFANNAFTITGTATADILGMGTLNINLAGFDNAGLVVTGGAVSNLAAAVTSNFSVSNVSYTVTSTRLSYDGKSAKFSLSGDAKANVGGMGTFDVTFGGATRSGMDLSSGRLDVLDSTINTAFTVAAVAFTPTSLRLRYTSTNGYGLSGQASVSLSGSTLIRVDLPPATGSVFNNGTLASLSMRVTDTFSIGGVSFSPTGLSLSYTASSNTFALSGSAELTVGGFDTSLVATFGAGSTPGLVVTNGALTSLALTVNSFSVAGVKYTGSGLTLSYSAASALYSFVGGATVSVGGMGAFGVTFGFGTSPGLVLSNGTLTSLDMGLSAAPFTVAGVSFTGTSLRFGYVASTKTYSLSGSAGVKVGGMNASSGSATASTFTATFGSGTTPGLVLTNGSLTSLLMSFSGGFSVGGVAFTVSSTSPATFQYKAGTNTTGSFAIGGSFTAGISGLGNVSVTFGSTSTPGLTVENGTVKKLSLTAQFSTSLAGVTFSGNNLKLDYIAASNSYTLGGTATVNAPFLGSATSATFGYGSMPGVVVNNGTLDKLALTVSGGFTVAGASFAANNFGLTYDRVASTLGLVGGANVTVNGMGTFGVTFGYTPLSGPSTLGAVVTSGNLTSLDLSLTSGFTVAGATFSTVAGYPLRLQYTSSNFKMSGSANVIVGTTSLGVNFANQGLVISNGRLQSMDMRVSSSINVFGVTVTASNLAFLYNGANGTFAIDSGNVHLETPAGRWGALSLDASFGTAATNYRKGLVFTNGTLTDLHLSLNGSFRIDGLTIQANGLTADYTRSSSTLDISGGASIQFASFSLGVSFPTRGLSINTTTGELSLNGLEVNTTFDLASGYSIEGKFGFRPTTDGMEYYGYGSVGVPKVGTVNAGFSLTRSYDSWSLDSVTVSYDAGTQRGLLIPGTGALYLTGLSGTIRNIGQGLDALSIDGTADFVYGPKIYVNGESREFFSAHVNVSITTSAITGGFTYQLAGGQLGGGSGNLNLDFARGSYGASIQGHFSTYIVDLDYNFGFVIKSSGDTFAIGSVQVSFKLPWPLNFSTGAGFYFQRIAGDDSSSFAGAWVDLGWWFGGVWGAEAYFDGRVNYFTGQANVNIYHNTFNARFYDGPIAGALVFADRNRNGLLDADESSVVTDANGDFDASLTSDPNVPLITIGGTDISTNLPNQTVYAALGGSRHVTPITTLVFSTYNRSSLSAQDANDRVAAALGLPAGFSSVDDDALSAALAGSATGAATFAKQVKLANFVDLAAATLSSDPMAPSRADLSRHVFAALADYVLAHPGSIDLSSALVLESLLASAASQSNVSIEPEVIAGAAQVIAAVNGRIDALQVAGNLSYLQNVVRVQKVGQGELSELLARAVAGDMAALVASATGSALDARIASASIGTLQAPRIAATNVSHLVGGDGTTTDYVFTIERDSTISPLVSVSVDYTTQDFTAHASDGDYIPTEGTLTWAPGETGAKTVTVTVHGHNGAQSGKAFLLQLRNPANAIVVKGGLGTILYGQATTTTTTLERVAQTPNSSGSATTAFGEEAGFRITVLATDGRVVPGYVTLYDGDQPLFTRLLDPSTGTLNVNAKDLPLGSHVLSARYLGQTDPSGIVLIAGSTSATLVQTVSKAEQLIGFPALPDVTYGEAAPALDAVSSTGRFVQFRIVSGPATLAGGQFSLTGAGTVVVEAFVPEDAVYNAATPVLQSFEVKPAQLTFTADPLSTVYGGAVPALTGTFRGFLGNDTAESLGLNPTLALANYQVAAGVYDVTATGPARVGNYAITYVASTLTVSRAGLVIVADNQTMVYGAALPNFTARYFGFVNGDDETVLSATPIFSAPGVELGVGDYAITLDSAAIANYDVAYIAGTVSVAPATVVVTPNSMSKVYGDTMPVLTASYSGFVNGDDETDLTVLPTLSSDASNTSHVGNYVIEASGAQAVNYHFVYLPGQFQVTPAPLMITAADVRATYGGDWSNPSVTYSGFVNGDDVNSLLSLPQVTTAPLGSAPGIYAIVASGASSSDYAIIYVNGMLTVGRARLTITPNDATTTHGKAATLSAVYQGLITGDNESVVSGLTLSTAPALANIGTYVITASGATSAHYDISYGTGTLQVLAAPLSVTVANLVKTYGQSLNLSALLGTTIDTGIGETLAVSYSSDGANAAAAVTTGGFEITAVLGNGTGLASNYDVTVVPGTLNVLPEGTRIAVSAPTVTYGQRGLVTVSVSAVDSFGGVPEGSVTLSVDGGAVVSNALNAGSWTFDVGVLSAGDHSLSFSYTDSAGNYVPSAGTGTLTVNKSSTTTALTSSSAGLGVTFTVLVSGNNGGNLPTGSVTFMDNTTNVPLGTVSLTGGLGTLNTTSLSPGLHAVTATYSGDTNFLSSLGTTSVTIGSSVYVLNPTASAALNVSGNGKVSVPGVLVVNSNSSTALTASGNASISASSIRVVGGVRATGNARFSITPVTGVAGVVDPLASLPIPSVSGNRGSVSVSGNTSQTINPGIYTQISVSGNGRLTLNPGIYVLAGGGLTVSGNAVINGTGVMIYNAGSNYLNQGSSFGRVTLSGNASVNLTALTTTVYSGIVLFQARDNTLPITLSGNGLGGFGSGTLYAPTAALNIGGNGQALKPTIIVSTLALSGNAGAFQLQQGAKSDFVSSTSTQILNPVLTVSVNPADGLTDEQMARLNDAIQYVNAALGKFEVNLSWAAPGADADVRIHFTDTTPYGGVEAGVLGFTTADNDLYLVRGWSYYTDANPTGIGAGQFDFLTLATHELGHTVGLGESLDPQSVMYEYLAPGMARRTFTDRDLALINRDTAPTSENVSVTASPPAFVGVFVPPTTPASALLSGTGGDVQLGDEGDTLLFGATGRELLVGSVRRVGNPLDLHVQSQAKVNTTEDSHNSKMFGEFTNRKPLSPAPLLFPRPSGVRSQNPAGSVDSLWLASSLDDESQELLRGE